MSLARHEVLSDDPTTLCPGGHAYDECAIVKILESAPEGSEEASYKAELDKWEPDPSSQKNLSKKFIVAGNLGKITCPKEGCRFKGEFAKEMEGRLVETGRRMLRCQPLASFVTLELPTNEEPET